MQTFTSLFCPTLYYHRCILKYNLSVFLLYSFHTLREGTLHNTPKSYIFNVDDDVDEEESDYYCSMPSMRATPELFMGMESRGTLNK